MSMPPTSRPTRGGTAGFRPAARKSIRRRANAPSDCVGEPVGSVGGPVWHESLMPLVACPIRARQERGQDDRGPEGELLSTQRSEEEQAEHAVLGEVQRLVPDEMCDLRQRIGLRR